MKRIAVLVVSLLAAVLFVAPAQADEACEFEVPALPGECLTEHVYLHLVNVTEERDKWQQQYADSVEYIGVLTTANDTLRSQVSEQVTLVQQLRQEVSMHKAALAVAYDWIDTQAQRIIRLRAKVKELRLIVRG